MRIKIKKYLLFSSILAIFSEVFFIHFLIDLKLFYLIILVNYLLLLKIKALKINIFFNVFLLGIFLHAIINYSIIGIPPNYMLSQIIGIAVISVYFYNYIKLFDFESVFYWYAKICIVIAIIGFPMFFLGISFNVNEDSRFCSIFSEPARYAIVTIPACYYFLKNKKYLYFTLLLITLILSNSSLGYIGCILMALSFISLKKIKKALFVMPVVISVFFVLYQKNESVNLRVNETFGSLKVLKTGKFEETTNLSSYALISNLYVAKLNFIEHPFGSGIGSHYYMYKKIYSKQFRTPEYIKINQLEDLNANDGSSFAIRLLSDFGVFGIIFIFISLSFCYKTFLNQDLIVSQSIAIFFILKLFRDGHYFPPDFFFFFWIFILSIQHKIKIKIKIKI